MHVVFIFNAGPWTIYYLGPRDVGTFGKSREIIMVIDLSCRSSEYRNIERLARTLLYSC
jgi:lactoylglutathione lyase